MIKFDILNRWSGEIQFTANIDCKKSDSDGIKIGLAIKWATKNSANLRGANLRGAYLSDADLSDADLRGAYLRGANLSDANLRGAYLSDADLSGANLRDANLRDANLRGADLSDANLSDANLRGAYLRGANLRGANLRGADLSGANLRGAYLSDAYLSGANLSGANLRGANLSDAYLSGANLSGADLSGANLDKDAIKKIDFQICPEQGSFQAWKKLSGDCVALLEIPAKAKRTSNLKGRKCRASYVKTLKIYEGKKLIKIAVDGKHDCETKYKVGTITRSDKWDDDPRLDCTNGIHFFLTKKEATEW